MNPSPHPCESASGADDVVVPIVAGAGCLRNYLVANYDALHRRLTRHLGCADLASDSLHDAWLRLGERGALPPTQCLDAYVFRVACNVATDHLRVNRSWRYTQDADTEFELLADRAPGPAAIVESRSDLQAVSLAMDSLSRRNRSIVLALRIDELSRQEVAAQHGLSLRRVDAVLQQSLKRCAERLEAIQCA